MVNRNDGVASRRLVIRRANLKIKQIAGQDSKCIVWIGIEVGDGHVDRAGAWRRKV